MKIVIRAHNPTGELLPLMKEIYSFEKTTEVQEWKCFSLNILLNNSNIPHPFITKEEVSRIIDFYKKTNLANHDFLNFFSKINRVNSLFLSTRQFFGGSTKDFGEVFPFFLNTLRTEILFNTHRNISPGIHAPDLCSSDAAKFVKFSAGWFNDNGKSFLIDSEETRKFFRHTFVLKVEGSS